MSTTPLDAYMTENGKKDADLAECIGRDRSIASKLRRGLLRPTLDVAAAIEKFTDGIVPMQSWVDAEPGAPPPFSTPTRGTAHRNPEVAHAS